MGDVGVCRGTGGTDDECKYLVAYRSITGSVFRGAANRQVSKLPALYGTISTAHIQHVTITTT